jgi:hypothetical protein
MVLILSGKQYNALSGFPDNTRACRLLRNGEQLRYCRAMMPGL